MYKECAHLSDFYVEWMVTDISFLCMFGKLATLVTYGMFHCHRLVVFFHNS